MHACGLGEETSKAQGENVFAQAHRGCRCESNPQPWSHEANEPSHTLYNELANIISSVLVCGVVDVTNRNAGIKNTGKKRKEVTLMSSIEIFHVNHY